MVLRPSKSLSAGAVLRTASSRSMSADSCSASSIGNASRTIVYPSRSRRSMCSARSAVVAALDMVHIVAHRGAVRPAPGPPAPCDVGRCSATVEAMADGALPDFNIPLDEKIEWMIQTKGYAVEPVPARDRHRPATGRLHLHDRLPGGLRLPRRRRLRTLARRREWADRPRRRDAPRRDRDPHRRGARRRVRQRPALRVRRSRSGRLRRAVHHRHRLAARRRVDAWSSCCGPTATASCPPRPASTAPRSSPNR